MILCWVKNLWPYHIFASTPNKLYDFAGRTPLQRYWVGNIPVTTTTKISPKALRYKWDVLHYK